MNLPNDITLGGAYDKGGTPALDLYGRVICCSGRYADCRHNHTIA